MAESLLTLYTHYVGRSQVPASYHLWAFLTALAACVADRVWVTKHAGAKLAPNLYVILTGPSGNGKGIAAGEAVELVREFPGVNAFVGEASIEFLLHWLAREPRDGVDPAKAYLVMTELGSSLGVGDSAKSFVKHLTDLYEGKAVHQRGTLAHGLHTLRRTCVTLLGCSTLEWFTESIAIRDLKAGFSRTVMVYEDRVPTRVTRPRYPADRDALRDTLLTRLVDVHAKAAGEMTLTADAEARHDAWYQLRPEPDDRDLVPAWQRGDDLWYKLAMLASLAESYDAGVIETRHAMLAQSMVDWLVYTEGPRLFSRMSGGVTTEPVQAVGRKLREAGGRVSGEALYAWGVSNNVTSRGIKEALANLLAAQMIDARVDGRTTWYWWVEREGMRYGAGGIVGDEDSDVDE